MSQAGASSTTPLRKYFGVDNRGRFSVREGSRQAFQDRRVADRIADHSGARLYVKDPQHATLGTDIHDRNRKHVGTAPFAPNGDGVRAVQRQVATGSAPRDFVSAPGDPPRPTAP